MSFVTLDGVIFCHIESRFWCRFFRDMGDQLFCRIDKYSHLSHWPDDSVSVVSIRHHFEKSIRRLTIWFWPVDLFHVSESYWVGIVHADRGDVAQSGAGALNRPINNRSRCCHVSSSGRSSIWPPSSRSLRKILYIGLLSAKFSFSLLLVLELCRIVAPTSKIIAPNFQVNFVFLSSPFLFSSFWDFIGLLSDGWLMPSSPHTWGIVHFDSWSSLGFSGS